MVDVFHNGPQALIDFLGGPDAKAAFVLILAGRSYPQSNYWNKVIARKHLKMLGPNDYFGVLDPDLAANFTADVDNNPFIILP